MKTITAEQTKAAFSVTVAVAEAIRTAGRIPAGTLYATLMPRLDLEAFNKLVKILKGAGLVEKRAHELIWVGPEVAA